MRAVAGVCQDCAYVEPKVMEDGPVMECHRFPPVQVGHLDEIVRMFPQVDGDDWCGEFRVARGRRRRP